MASSYEDFIGLSSDMLVSDLVAPRVPAFASQLNLLSLFLAVFAAVLPVGRAFFDQAFARRMSALRLFGHCRTSARHHTPERTGLAGFW
jgi:hypothetical protein